MWKTKTKGFFLKEKNAIKEGKKIIAYIVQDLGKNICAALCRKGIFDRRNKWL